MSRLRSSDLETRAEAVHEAEKILVEELTKIRSVNGRFIEILTEEILFAEKVGLDTATTGSGSDRTASLVDAQRIPRIAVGKPQIAAQADKKRNADF
jgi:hypothetical protein